MAAGGLEVHHPLTLHSSHPNTTTRWRRAIILRYQPASEPLEGRMAHLRPLMVVCWCLCSKGAWRACPLMVCWYLCGHRRRGAALANRNADDQAQLRRRWHSPGPLGLFRTVRMIIDSMYSCMVGPMSG